MQNGERRKRKIVSTVGEGKRRKKNTWICIKLLPLKTVEEHSSHSPGKVEALFVGWDVEASSLQASSESKGIHACVHTRMHTHTHLRRKEWSRMYSTFRTTTALLFFFTLVHSLKIKAGNIYFYLCHTIKLVHHFSYDFLYVCNKESVVIKNKANKDPKPKAYVLKVNTHSKMLTVKQMNPLECKIFHQEFGSFEMLHFLDFIC